MQVFSKFSGYTKTDIYVTAVFAFRSHEKVSKASDLIVTRTGPSDSILILLPEALDAQFHTVARF